MKPMQPLYYHSDEAKNAYVQYHLNEGYVPQKRDAAGVISRPDVRWGWYDPTIDRWWPDDYARRAARLAHK